MPKPASSSGLGAAAPASAGAKPASSSGLGAAAPASAGAKPAYWAVIFSSRRTQNDDWGYAETARRMEELARRQPGFLGIESVRDAEGVGVTVSYWDSLDAIAAWNAHDEHRTAQIKGRETWYESFHLRIAKVEREKAYP
jgi:heme-degrading monooxygenase HmoA